MSKHLWAEGALYSGVPDVRCVCYVCDKRFMLSTGWADRKGEPFKAYYCNECKEKADA